MEEKYRVTGMTCAACIAHVEKAVKRIEGVKSAEASLLTMTVKVEVTEGSRYDGKGEKLRKEVEKELKAGGYGLLDEKDRMDLKSEREKEEKEAKKRLLCLLLSAFLTLLLMYLSMGRMIGLPIPSFCDPAAGSREAVTFISLQAVIALLAVSVHFGFFTRGYRALFHRAPNMDSLIAASATASFLYGIYALVSVLLAAERGEEETVLFHSHHLYFESAAMIVTLVSFGKMLEASAKRRAGSAVRDLLSLRPERATRVLEDGSYEEAELSEIKTNDLLLVREGESIPKDGRVERGRGSVNEAALTGESIPVEKEQGAAVTGATLLESGSLVVRVTEENGNSTLDRIIRLLEDAAASKAPVARLADRISGFFVPAVLGISLVTFLIWLLLGQPETAIQCAVSVLVISCPCSLGLATPTAIMVGTARGAKMGILMKSAEGLETLSKIDTVFLDKTGTITSGRPEVKVLLPAFGEEDTLLSYAASVERNSSHPLARAIVRAAEERELPLLPVEDYRTGAGLGVEGKIGGKSVIVGKPSYLKALLTAENGREKANTDFDRQADLLEEEGLSVVLVAFDGELLGAIGLFDLLKPDSKEAIADFESMGIETVILTGDNEKTAAAVAKESGASSYCSGLLPQEKEGILRARKEEGRITAMVGDGINDAPALMRADVGIAIGAGTDVAIDSADIVLSRSSLSDAASALRLSRAVMVNIKENLFWALFYNSVGIPIAAGVLSPFGILLSPMIGAACMSLSSVSVVSNALRLRRVRLSRYGWNKRNHKQSKLQEEQKMFGKKEDVTYTFSVDGMMCGKCKAHVENALTAVKGVKEAAADLEAKSVTVTAKSSVKEETLKDAVRQAGYEC